MCAADLKYREWFLLSDFIFIFYFVVSHIFDFLIIYVVYVSASVVSIEKPDDENSWVISLLSTREIFSCIE